MSSKSKFKEAYSHVRFNRDEADFDPLAKTSPTTAACGETIMLAAVEALANKKAIDPLAPEVKQ